MASKPIIVLIPGGFHGPESWDKTAAHLRTNGYEVLTPALTVTANDPSGLAGKSFEDDAAVILKELTPHLDEGKEAVLVGHSYGSVVAPIVCEGQTVEERAAKGLKGGIRGMVFLAGFAYPVRGKNIMGGDEPSAPMPWFTTKDGVYHLGEEAKPLFFSDLGPEEMEAAWATVYRWQSVDALAKFPKYIASDVKVAKTWVFTTEDKVLTPDYQNMFIPIGGFDKVLNIASGHEPMYSQPEKLAEVIVEAAGK